MILEAFHLWDSVSYPQKYIQVFSNGCRCTIVQRQFRTKFGKQPPSDNSIRRWYAHFQETGCVCIPELKVRIRTAIETITAEMLHTVWTNSIILLMFVESQRLHIQSTCKVCNKTWSVILLNKKMHILLSQMYCIWQVVKTPYNHFE